MTLAKGQIELEEKQGRRSDLEIYFDRIADGWTADEIILNYPKAYMYSNRLKTLEQVRLKSEAQKDRDVKVTYLYGPAGVGKTRFVFENYPRDDVYRVTNYEHPWDTYNAESVVCLDEFDGQLKFDFLLNVCDRYPLLLPCRYSDRWALFTEVLIVSNLPLDDHYSFIRHHEWSRWRAFLRRIDRVIRMSSSGEIIDESVDFEIGG